MVLKMNFATSSPHRYPFGVTTMSIRHSRMQDVIDYAKA